MEGRGVYFCPRRMNINGFTIRADSRDKDKYRWTFESFLDDKELIGVKNEKVEVGDYEIIELPEKTLCIERKKSFSEISNNVSKKDTPRFKRELEKMKEYKYSYIIMEFTFHDLLNGSKFTQLSPAYILSVLLEIEAVYGINIHFCGHNAEAFCYRIMRKIWFLENGHTRWLN